MIHIRKTHSRFISFLGMITITVFGIVSILGTGGGGGDGGSSQAQPLAYTGNTDPAVISTDNATALVSNVLFGNMAGDAIPITVETSTPTPSNQKMLIDKFAPLYSDNLIAALTDSDFTLIPTGVVQPVSGTLLCDNGYNATFEGSLDNVTFIGTVTITYTNCVLGSITYNGTAVVTFHDTDTSFYPPLPVDFTMNFYPLMTIRSSDNILNMSGTGTIRIQANLINEKETITMNFVSRNNNSGVMSKYSNFVIVTIYDDVLYPTLVVSQTFTGRSYEQTYGYVDVTTNGVLMYSSISLLYPDSGGPVWFTGGPPTVDADPTRIQMNVTDAVWISFDLDIDGEVSNGFEITGCSLKWEDLLNPQPLVNCPPPE